MERNEKNILLFCIQSSGRIFYTGHLYAGVGFFQKIHFRLHRNLSLPQKAF